MNNNFKANFSGIAFVLAIIIMLVADSFMYFSFRQLIENEQDLHRALATQNSLDHILIHLNELETGPRGYIITGEEHFLDPYVSALAPSGIAQHLRELRQLSRKDNVLLRYQAKLEPLVAKKINFMQTLVALRKQRGFDAAKAMVESDIGNAMMGEIRMVIARMKQREGELVQQRSILASVVMQNTIISIAAGGVVSFLFLLLSFVIINHEVGARKRDAEKLRLLNSELDERIASRTQALLESTEKLRGSEENFRMLVDGVKEYALFLLDTKGVVITWNKGAELLKGYREEEIIGRNMSIFYTDEDNKVGKPARLLQQAISEGRAADTGWRVRQDGTRFIADVLITALYDGNHQLKGFAKVTRDVSERTKNELKIGRLSRMYATLGQVNEAIVRVKVRDELYKTICHVAVEYGKFDQAWIGLYDQETALVTLAVADGKEHGSFLPGARNIKKGSPKSGIIASAVATGNVAYCNNIPSALAMQESCQELCSSGHQSAAAVPVRENGVIVAVLTLCSEVAEYFDADEIHLLEEMGRDISFALDTMDMEEKNRKGEAALHTSELQFREMFESNSAIMIIFDPTTGDVVDVNKTAAEFYGWPREVFRTMNLGAIDTLPPEELQIVIKQAVLREKNYFIVRHRRANGSIRDVEIYPTRLNIRAQTMMYSIIHDITERQRIEKANTFHLSILDAAPLKTVNDLLQLTIDEAKRLTESSIGFLHYVDDNQLAVSLQGWSTNTITEMCKVALPSQHYSLNEVGIWADALRKRSAMIHNDYASNKYCKGMPEGHAELRREAVVPIFRNNKIVALLGVGNKALDYNEDDTALIGLLGNVAWDVISKKITDDEHKILQVQQYVIENLAMHDSLTGLPNRRLLSERIDLTIAQCRRNKTIAALFIFDLDKFKIVNDTLGHQVGDLLLKEVATRTLGVLRRSGDSLARLGGDEYVVLLPHIAELSNAFGIAEKIRNAILQPFELEGHTINISCSIGIALYPEHGEDEQTLMKHADAAMYQAKNEGLNRIKLFSAEIG